MNGVGQGEEVVTVLLCEEWYKAMVEFGCVVNARIRGGGKPVCREEAVCSSCQQTW